MTLFDACLYYRLFRKSVVFMLLYVDDILLVSPDINNLLNVKIDLGREFDMKDLGKTSKILVHNSKIFF